MRLVMGGVGGDEAIVLKCRVRHEAGRPHHPLVEDARVGGARVDDVILQ